MKEKQGKIESLEQTLMMLNNQVAMGQSYLTSLNEKITDAQSKIKDLNDKDVVNFDSIKQLQASINSNHPNVSSTQTKPKERDCDTPCKGQDSPPGGPIKWHVPGPQRLPIVPLPPTIVAKDSLTQLNASMPSRASPATLMSKHPRSPWNTERPSSSQACSTSRMLCTPTRWWYEHEAAKQTTSPQMTIA